MNELRCLLSKSAIHNSEPFKFRTGSDLSIFRTCSDLSTASISTGRKKWKLVPLDYSIEPKDTFGTSSLIVLAGAFCPLVDGELILLGLIDTFS